MAVKGFWTLSTGCYRSVKGDPSQLILLRDKVQRFCDAYDKAAQDLIRAMAKNTERPEQPGRREAAEPWALEKIQEVLFSRLHMRLDTQILQQLYLFLIDPQDDMLYYAATASLPFKPPLQVTFPFRLDTIGYPGKLAHVRGRIVQLEENSRLRNGLLTDLYEQLMHQEWSLYELTEHAPELRALLRCLPQELECGVAGECVRTGAMAISASADDPRWDKTNLPYTFFLQKLSVEQLFGIASGNWLAAMPIYDCAQAVGCVFVATSDEPNEAQKASLLDTAEMASQYLASYRDHAFVDTVITMQDRALISSILARQNPDPKRQLFHTVGELMGQVLRHRVLLAVNYQQKDGQPEFTGAWWIPPHEYARRHVQTGALIGSQVLKQCLEEAIRGDGIAHIPPQILEEHLSQYAKNEATGELLWRTALHIPFDETTGFLALLSEEPKSIRLAMDRLQQKLHIVKSLARLKTTFARASEMVPYSLLASHARHRWCQRYAAPVRSYAQDLAQVVSDLPPTPDSMKRLADISQRLARLSERMESQWHSLEQLRPGGSASGATVFNLSEIITKDCKAFFEDQLFTRDKSLNTPHYSTTVKLIMEVSPRLQIRGHRHAVITAFYDVLENTLNEYAISRSFLKKHPERCTVTVRAKESNGMIEVEIQDLASGITEEKAGILNERFSQIASGQVDSWDPEKQTGLYIAPIAFARVSAPSPPYKRGRMEVRPNPGGGTTFTIRLPTYDANDAEEPIVEDLNEIHPRSAFLDAPGMIASH